MNEWEWEFCKLVWWFGQMWTQVFNIMDDRWSEIAVSLARIFTKHSLNVFDAYYRWVKGVLCVCAISDLFYIIL